MVRDLIIENHYIGTVPAVVRCCYAVYLGEELVGACIFSAGARHAHRLLAGAQPNHVATLARFWMADGLPPNNESRVLGLILRDLRREGSYKLLVSFADPRPDTVGSCTRPRAGPTSAPPTPSATSSSTASASIAQRLAAFRLQLRIPFAPHRPCCLGPHQPAQAPLRLRLGPSWRWRLRRAPLPYPKRDGS